MKELFGNEELKNRFLTQAKQGVLPHAFTVVAPKGGGKHTFAHFCTKVILCLNPESAPCRNCKSCKMIEGGGHPDLTVVSATGDKVKSVKVDDIREMRTVCSVKPAVGKHRVVIIENAEWMTTASQNALLKILEEPPEGTFFFLLTDHTEKLLPTVRSRCVQLNLAPLTEEEIAHLLPKTASVHEVASFASGNGGEALHAVSADGRKVYEDVLLFPDLLFDATPYNLALYRDRMTKSRETLSAYLFALQKLLRDVCLLKEDGEASLYFDTRRDEVQSFANRLTKRALNRIIELLQNLQSNAENTGCDIKLATLSALLLCWEETH